MIGFKLRCSFIVKASTSRFGRKSLVCADRKQLHSDLSNIMKVVLGLFCFKSFTGSSRSHQDFQIDLVLWRWSKNNVFSEVERIFCCHCAIWITYHFGRRWCQIETWQTHSKIIWLQSNKGLFMPQKRHIFIYSQQSRSTSLFSLICSHFSYKSSVWPRPFSFHLITNIYQQLCHCTTLQKSQEHQVNPQPLCFFSSQK